MNTSRDLQDLKWETGISDSRSLSTLMEAEKGEKGLREFEIRPRGIVNRLLRFYLSSPNPQQQISSGKKGKPQILADKLRSDLPHPRNLRLSVTWHN